MPKVIGPCFSLSAFKSLGKALIYQRKRGMNLLFKHHRPGSREPTVVSPKQESQRNRIADLVSQWRALGSWMKEVWDYRAKLVKYIGTGYHYFIHKGGIVGLLGDVRIRFNDFIAKVTSLGYLEVKTHTPDFCFASDYADAQALETILTPSGGKKIEIISVYASVEGDGTNVTLEFDGADQPFFKLYTKNRKSSTGNVICAEGETDQVIKLTCPVNTFISIGYDEH